MGEVVDLMKHRPHCTGEAICGSCLHEWIAVAPAGVVQFKCPQCSLLHGGYKFPFGSSGYEYTHHCGGSNFFIMKEHLDAPSELRCRRCGLEVKE